MLTGLFLIVARRTAVMQALGYPRHGEWHLRVRRRLAVSEPTLIEMGVLLDVLLAVFIMTIMIHHIGREFDHVDTDSLSALKD